ncbi:MAG: hypothetical protein PCFJNLEI_01460 [Verrucomicrobiae bacterium]|nr:hypothetical protein [Verrucomicrobiae bacterium]
MTNRFCRQLLALSIFALLSLGLLSTTSVLAVDVYTDPVGFVKSTITNTLSGNTFTPIGLPLQRMKADQGLVTSVTSDTISGGCATCGTANYATKITGTLTNPQYYVQFLTGNAVGRYFAIQTNTSTTLTLLTGGENLTALSAGPVLANDRYCVRPFWRIRDIFGDVTNTPLQAGAATGSADNLYLMNNGAFVTIFPRKSGAPSFVTNWFQVGIGNVDDLPIMPDEALFVLRRSANLTNLVLIGDVAITNGVTVLETGYNFVANAFPAGVTISNSLLASPGTGFNPGAGSGSADNVFVWDSAAGAWRTMFYRIQSVPPPVQTNWFIVGPGVTNNLVLEPGTGYLIYNKTSGGLWNRPVPYTP